MCLVGQAQLRRSRIPLFWGEHPKWCKFAFISLFLHAGRAGPEGDARSFAVSEGQGISHARFPPRAREGFAAFRRARFAVALRCCIHGVGGIPGAPLWQILAAGEWKSPAFLQYLDLNRLETDLVVQALVDESDGEDVHDCR